ncbi:MAG: hypothetical protein HY754_03690, partial [Nitrospirae bacterium]|nr:hypothetical protein [Nitrospirota bacterium]
MDNQRVLRFLRFILVVTTFVSLCFILLRPVGDVDFFWHLSTGRWIIEHLALPADDPFNYTTPATSNPRKQLVLTSYWLSQIFYYGIYYVSGWGGFIILRFIILGSLIYFVYKRARDSDRTILFGFIAIAMIVFARLYRLERPQVFSFLFFAILLYLLDEMKRNSRAEDQQSSSVTERQSDRATVASADSPPPQADHRFMVRQAHHDNPCQPEPVEGHLFTYCSLPLLMLIWANMHAGFIVGQGVI